MENFNSMSKPKKIYALESEIAQEEYYLENASNRIKSKNRLSYIKDLKIMLSNLTK